MKYVSILYKSVTFSNNGWRHNLTKHTVYSNNGYCTTPVFLIMVTTTSVEFT